MRRREFIGIAGSVLLTRPFMARAQQPGGHLYLQRPLLLSRVKRTTGRRQTDLRKRPAIYQKNNSHRTMVRNEYEPKLADEKGIELRLPIARLAAIIGPTFAGL